MKQMIPLIILSISLLCGCDAGEEAPAGPEDERVSDTDEFREDSTEFREDSTEFREDSTDPVDSATDFATDPADTAADTEDRPQDTASESLLDLAFSCDYVLDNSKTSDQNYLEEHKTTIQIAPAFFGRIGEKIIPEAGAEGVHYEVFGLKREKSVIVLQMAFDEETHKPVNPFIQLSLDAEQLVAGSAYEVDPGAPFSRAMVFNVKDNLEFDCVYAVMEGQIFVKMAKDLHQSEGGVLWLHGTGLQVFPVEAASQGDLTKMFNEENKQTCAQTGSGGGL